MSEQKEKFSLKAFGNAFLDTLSSCLSPIIPVLISAAMFKTVLALLGPDMLNVITAESDLYVLLNFVGDAGFYFLPVILGYTCAKKFEVEPVMGMFLGAVLIHPTLVDLASSGASFSVYGIPCSLQNYASSIVPIMLSVFVMGYVEKFFKKIMPEALSGVFTPTCTMAVMLPVALCVMGPIGSWIGALLNDFIIMLGNMGGIGALFAMIIMGIIWEFVIMAGMHWIIIATITSIITVAGYESVISPICLTLGFTVGGMCLGAALRMKDPEEKSLCLTYVITQAVGGVTEPGLYGVGVKYKKPFIGMVTGGAIAAVYAWIVGLTVYNFIPVASFLMVFSYVGGSMMNVVHAVITCVIAFVVSAVVTYLLGVDEKPSK